jgi:glycosyltransferase involved in cell wall biosynthesis
MERKINLFPMNNRQKIVITAVHPAPYMDVLFNSICDRYDLSVLYNYKKSAAKTWKKYTPYQGEYFEDLTFWQWLHRFYSADLIVFGGWNLKQNRIGILFSFFSKTKIAVFSDYPEKESRNLFIRLFKRAFIKSFVDYMFCASPSTCDYYRKRYHIKSNQIKLFPYAHNFELVNNQIEQNNLTKIKVFVANNFRPRKGYETLYLALKKLKELDHLNDFQIVISGSGEQFEHYKELFSILSVEIKLLGWIENEEYVKNIKESHVFIHASTFEPFGIPPLDAMACGKVVMASDGIHSVNKIIEYNTNGYIFPAGNSDALLQCMVEVFQNKGKLKKIGERAAESVKNTYFASLWSKSIDECFK